MIEIVDPVTQESEIFGHYHGGDGEIEDEAPTNKILKKNMDSALANLMKNISYDIRFATVLKERLRSN